MKSSDDKNIDTKDQISMNIELIEPFKEVEPGKLLCKHCKRTSDNNIRCLGMCVADNEY
tara:strand:+ start:1256 stop:1432 length:177 start_codon:yes stop_codon:yes gene_type:complete